MTETRKEFANSSKLKQGGEVPGPGFVAGLGPAARKLISSKGAELEKEGKDIMGTRQTRRRRSNFRK